MSNYRDDVQETGVGGDKSRVGMKTMLGSIGFAKDTILTGLLLLNTVTATASDELTGKQFASTYETVVVSDSVITAVVAEKYSFDIAAAKDSLMTGYITRLAEYAAAKDSLPIGKIVAQVTDNATASDQVTLKRASKITFQDNSKATDSLVNLNLLTLTDTAIGSDSVTSKSTASVRLIDTAFASDALSSQQLISITETAKVSDALTAKRAIHILFSDYAKGSDSLLVRGSQQLAESATASDSTFTKLHGTMRLTESATAADSLQLSTLSKSLNLTDSAKISDAITVGMVAVNNWQDFLSAIDDSTLTVNGEVAYLGQTWTANTENWAMSRYNQYPYKRLAVINGVLYGENENGVYRLDAANEKMTAVMTTGKLDLGQGKLVHPVSAYLEYELQGKAAMAVHSTQLGVLQTYKYALVPERSGELTNGRFIFGRGLRGRHFTFELTMNGTQGFINDLSISSLPTTRRV